MSRSADLQSQMYAIIEDFQQSGLTQKDFCSKKNIALTKFQYWQRKYQEQSEDMPSGFLRLTSDKNHFSPDPQSIIVLHYPNGVSMQLPYDTPMIIVRSFLNLV